jgi:hypothetical protein
MFDPNKIKSFNLEDLHGKTLKIFVSREDHPNGVYVVTFGIDIETGVAYLLNVCTRKKGSRKET